MAPPSWPPTTHFGQRLTEQYPSWQALRQIPTGRTTTSPDGELTFHELALVDSAQRIVSEAIRSSLVGDTFHVLMQLRYVGIDWEHDGSTFGRRLLLKILGDDRRDRTWEELQERVDAMIPAVSHPQLEGIDSEEVARLAFVIGIHNATHIRRDPVGALADQPRATLTELLAVPDHEQVTAVTRMLHLAVERLPDPTRLTDARAGVAAFAGQTDLLLDGTLLEVKTLAAQGRTPMIDRNYAYQLLTYLLTIDPRVTARIDGGVQQVGWYYARHGLLWVRSADDFLSVMAGRPVALADATAEAATWMG